MPGIVLFTSLPRDRSISSCASSFRMDSNGQSPALEDRIETIGNNARWLLVGDKRAKLIGRGVVCRTSEFFGENHYFVRAIVLEIGREEFLSIESDCCLDHSLSLSLFCFLFYSRFNWNPVLRFVRSFNRRESAVNTVDKHRRDRVL